jgi:hypothetical protein
VHNLGADGLFIEAATPPAQDGFMVVSPPSRPGPLRRLLAALRGR